MKKKFRVVNESTGETFNTHTLSCAQRYRDRRDLTEFVAVYGIESGALIAETVCRFAIRRDDLLGVPTLSTQDIQVLEELVTNGGIYSGAFFEALVAPFVLTVPCVTATDEDGTVLDFGPDVSKDLLRKAALLKRTRDGGNGHIDESWKRGEYVNA